MSGTSNPDLEEFAKELFKGAQRPIAWLLSAERLRDAAEAILENELPNEKTYLRAYANAEQELEANDSSIAEIKATPPNYPPAQMLYAYAIENVLKGLAVTNDPQLIQEEKLDRKLDSYDLIDLAKKADFTVNVQETTVLERLSQLSTWSARYPVALTLRKYKGVPNSDELLDYGSAHPIMRGFFERARKELEDRLPQPIELGFEVLVSVKSSSVA